MEKLLSGMWITSMPEAVVIACTGDLYCVGRNDMVRCGMKQIWTKRGWTMKLGARLTGVCVVAAMSLLGGMLAAAQAHDAAAAAVLGPAQTQKMLPPAVYFKGQSATTQIRNSGGVKFADGAYLLAVLVDTSGYSSEVAQKYQAYLITEDAVRVGGKRLPAGIYGVGFVGGQFLVMDVGAHTLLSMPSATDEAMKRPRPLEVTQDSGTYRLYEGRRYVTLSR